MFPPSHTREVSVKRLSRRIIRKSHVRQLESAMQKSARAAGIDHQPRANRDFLSPSLANEHHPFVVDRCPFQLCLVEILDTTRLGFANEKMIEVRAIPVRVSDFLLQAGCHEQLVPPVRITRKRSAEVMMVKRESALQARDDTRVRLLPGTPLRQRRKPRQIVSLRQF